jgi:inosose dehydratase
VKDSLRWAYGLNQWNLRMDAFVRHEHQLRTFKTLSALGFDHVELTAGTGRWDNVGRPEVIELNHGSPQGFLDFLRRGGIAGVSSFVWDPAQPAEEEGWAFRSTRNPDDHKGIVAEAQVFIDFIAAVGGEQLVARPTGSAWMGAPFSAAEIPVVAALWNQVGAAAQKCGIAVSLHYDCLGALHTESDLIALLQATDPALVGMALDTAELTIAGIDPVAFYQTHTDRVTHVQLKDTRFTDTASEYLMPGAESSMLRGGGGRHIERWFYELGTRGGLVDIPGFVASLRTHSFAGWVVVESDQSGTPAETAMLNSWYLQHLLNVEVER